MSQERLRLRQVATGAIPGGATGASKDMSRGMGAAKRGTRQAPATWTGGRDWRQRERRDRWRAWQRDEDKERERQQFRELLMRDWGGDLPPRCLSDGFAVQNPNRLCSFIQIKTKPDCVGRGGAWATRWKAWLRCSPNADLDGRRAPEKPLWHANNNC